MNFINQKAIYLQIADFIGEQILLKKILVANKIPSMRELAVNLEVNPNTVMRAYAYLEEQEIIVMQRGIGYFVAEDAEQRVLALKKQEFLTDHLPQMLRSMQLLNINIEELTQLYQDFLGNKSVCTR